MIEAGVLLYRNTKNDEYLTDAQKTALGTHKFNAYYAWDHTRDSNGLLSDNWNERNEKQYKWLLDNNSMIELFSQFASLK